MTLQSTPKSSHSFIKRINPTNKDLSPPCILYLQASYLLVSITCHCSVHCDFLHDASQHSKCSLYISHTQRKSEGELIYNFHKFLPNISLKEINFHKLPHLPISIFISFNKVNLAHMDFPMALLLYTYL